jgi:hypothetical protein
MIGQIIIYAIAFILAVLRIAGHKSPTFQAVAHLFVGGLFTAAYMKWKVSNDGPPDYALLSVQWLGLAVVLSLIELACFIWFRFQGS